MINDKFIYNEVLVDNKDNSVYFTYTLVKDNKNFPFKERLVLPCAVRKSRSTMSCLRALHLALGISYYKSSMPSTIEHSYQMDDIEARFWNEVFINGLGEFLYVNQIPVDRLAKFKPQAGRQIEYEASEVSFDKGSLLGVGGGKDSIVARELLRELNLSCSGFVLASQDAVGVTIQVSSVMGIDLLIVKRYLDQNLISFQQLDGNYKGHVPVSLFFALCGSLLASIYGFSHVILADEASSSIPRINWQGRMINHQWSKSLEFELKFKQYVHSFITDSIDYFSIIRQLSSVAVAKLFASYPNYFTAFTSDNFVFRIDASKRPSGRWSLESPKTLSSFILLAPWMSVEEVLNIFEQNLFDFAELETMFLSLFAIGSPQPLDCVGTVDELQVSLNLIYQQSKFIDSPLMQLAIRHNLIDGRDYKSLLKDLLELSEESAIPATINTRLTKLLTEKLS